MRGPWRIRGAKNPRRRAGEAVSDIQVGQIAGLNAPDAHAGRVRDGDDPLVELRAALDNYS